MALAFVGGLFSMSELARADVFAADGLLEEIKKSKINVGGWANAGITYNANDPVDNFNGPVTFGDRSAEFQLNQLNLFIQKAVATEGTNWDVGARFDVMFGTDAAFTQAYGAFSQGGGWDLDLLRGNNNRFYGLAVPQAYAEIYAPFGNGLNIKAGRFYTPIGYETVPAPDNFFYTHAYTMQYGEPFTHTGILFNYAVSSNWSLMAGTVTGSETGGWDGNFSDQFGNWAGIGGVTWTSTNMPGTSFNVSGTYGSTSETNDADWSMYSMVLKHNITDKMHLVLQHDHGFADEAAAGGADASWYGVLTHLYYDVKDDVSVGVRGEWFRDHNGVRVFTPGRPFQGVSPGAGSYYAVTAGVTWKAKTWLKLRPNIRYDWADGVDPFDAGTKSDQFLFSTDMTVTF
jgi:hypothetical protein